MNVSILAVRAYLELVSDIGVSREEFLAAARIDAERLDDIYGRLALAELDRVQEVALALTGDPALGLHMAERASAPAYDVMGYLVSHAATLRECFQNLSRYSRILSDVTTTIEEHADVATVVCRFMGPPDTPAVRLRAELVMMGFLRVLRSFCGESTMPHEVLFEHAAPPYRDEYSRLFGGRERFEQPVTALRFDRVLLESETAYKNPRLKSILTDEAERLLERLERAATTAERIREWLALRGAKNPPAMMEAAKQLGISVRSLRRRLVEEGASYPKLVEEAQAALAKRLLDASDRSIYEVAFEMGFSDPSAFHRAFRRWTGMTPVQYRENAR